MGVVEEVVTEPEGSARADYDAVAASLDEAMHRHMQALLVQPTDELLQRRYERFRYIDSLVQAEPEFGPKV
jgi:acetyl-CoA carboxylase carboxyl transferase subunit alpha